MRTRYAFLLPGPAALLALALAGWLGLAPLKHFDLFFHLAGGRFILEHGFTRVDPFSLTGTAGWVPHEWGFGVLCVLLGRWLGAGGPALLVAALVSANVLLLWKALGRAASGRLGLLALSALGLVLLVHAPTWQQERPFHLGHLFFTLAVLCVQAWRAGDERVVWVFPLLGVAWANLHGSWPLGPALLCGTALGALLDAPGPASWRRALRAAAFGVAAFLAAGLGPDGTAIYLYPLHHSMLESTQGIVEWRTLDLDVGWSWAYLALLGATLFAAGRAPSRRLASLLPAAVLGLAALKVQRHAPFAAVLLALALVEHGAQAPAAEAGAAISEAWRRLWRGLDAALARWSARAGGAFWPALVLATLTVIHATRPTPMEEGVKRSRVPMAALQALRQLPPGKVLNAFVLGGPISFFAGPDYKVFIDSRNDPFPLAVHQDHLRLVWGEPGWEEALAKYDPDYLFWKVENPGNILLDNLRARGGWREQVRDGSYVLWVRERPAATTRP